MSDLLPSDAKAACDVMTAEAQAMGMYEPQEIRYGEIVWVPRSAYDAAIERAVLAEGQARVNAQTVVRQAQEMRQMERDFREEMREASAEASWKERQGEDYGSY